MNKIKQLIEQGYLEEALDAMSKVVQSESPRLKNDLILTRSRYASLQRDQNNGIIGQENFMIQRNRIKAAALSLANMLPDDMELPKETIISTGIKEEPKKQKKKTLKLFISYSQKDKHFLEDFKKHLVPLEKAMNIDSWDDHELIPGTKWNEAIMKELAESDVIVMLTSGNSLATNYIYDIEMEKALERHKNGEVVVIPVILSPCNWEMTPLANLALLPRKAKPINKHEDQDLVWIEVTKGIKRAIDEWKK